MPSTRNEEENYYCFLKIMNVAVCDGLREIFKQEWDKQYGTTRSVWDDTCISGNALYNMEKPRLRAKAYLNLYQSGERSGWDISALADAILFSNALRMHLAPHVSNNVDELRVLRNHLNHKFASQHKMPDAAFNNAYKKVNNCFKALKLSTVNVEKIRNSSRGNYHAIHLRKIICISLTILIGVVCYLVANTSEAKTIFSVLPTRPVHLVANRSRTVDAILKELHNLSIRNNRALSYLYISGNPGSGKSQLARLVGQRYGTNVPVGWFRSSTKVFVMTLSGRSLHDILESYADFARRVDCNENNIASIINSNKTNTTTKIKSLRTEIAKALRDFESKYTWLLIVDNVIKLNEISAFFPEDWQGGQVLITTQDMSSVPSNSSLTVHLSVSQGMDPEESCEFLTDLSGLAENQDLVGNVAKELDYQPLALASAGFYVKQVRESKASPQFTWKDYLKKLDEGKRELTEMKLTKVNMPAYSLTMSTAVLLAVKMSAESDPVLKHTFTFLSYVSNEAQSLKVVVSYVLRVDKEKDREDVALTIRQCSLILHSDEQKVVSISLHRVVHDSIQLYIIHGANGNAKSRVPLYVFQSLLQQKCALGEIALIPHLKAFYARTKNISSEVMVLSSMKIKMKQRMQKQIFDMTSVLIQHGEFLLSKNYLNLALKMTANGDNKGNGDLKESLHVLFPKIGEIYNNLGTVENVLGNTKQARKYLKEALKILLIQHGPSHKTRKSVIKINLGRKHYAEGTNLKLALMRRKYLTLSVDIFRKMTATNHLNLANSYYNLGLVHYELNDLPDAEVCFRRALEIYSKQLQSSDKRMARASQNLARVLEETGQLHEAKMLDKQYGRTCRRQKLVLAIFVCSNQFLHNIFAQARARGT
ncbi:Kinesin light chain, partial [Paramuricea clavata]